MVVQNSDSPRLKVPTKVSQIIQRRVLKVLHNIVIPFCKVLMRCNEISRFKTSCRISKRSVPRAMSKCMDSKTSVGTDIVGAESESERYKGDCVEANKGSQT